MTWVIAAIIAPIPLFHLWLHAALDFWKKQPFIYYTFCGLIWFASFLVFKKINEISPVFFATNNIAIKIGFALMAIGAILMIGSLLTLGFKRFFMLAVFYPQSVKQTYIVNKLFKFIPHPAYIGYLFIALGIFFTDGKLYLALIFISLFILTPIVIYFEEKELSNRIHE